MWPVRCIKGGRSCDFYSHIPCGMWPTSPPDNSCNFLFLLTHPVWDVTTRYKKQAFCGWISTHTSRVGCDADNSACEQQYIDFYSHIPCGMWQWSLLPAFLHRCKFLLTHPVWDVTDYETETSQGIFNFYSHIPCGMWPCVRQVHTANAQFLLTHPVWDVTLCACPAIRHALNFYSHIPCGMWPALLIVLLSQKNISTHTSRVGCDFCMIYLYDLS